VAEFQVERRDAKLAPRLHRPDANLHRRRKRRLGGNADDKILAGGAVIQKPQLLDNRNGVVLEGVVNGRVVRENERWRDGCGCGLIHDF
jgi:hypothetical protein